jgi:hypothetical protein
MIEHPCADGASLDTHGCVLGFPGFGFGFGPGFAALSSHGQGDGDGLLLGFAGGHLGFDVG